MVLLELHLWTIWLWNLWSMLRIFTLCFMFCLIVFSQKVDCLSPPIVVRVVTVVLIKWTQCLKFCFINNIFVPSLVHGRGCTMPWKIFYKMLLLMLYWSIWQWCWYFMINRHYDTVCEWRSGSDIKILQHTSWLHFKILFCNNQASVIKHCSRYPMSSYDSEQLMLIDWISELQKFILVPSYWIADCRSE